jgi:hypothetical protein
MTGQLLVLGLCAIFTMALVGMGVRLLGIERRVTRLSGMDARLDLLLKHFSIEYAPDKDVPPAVVDALREGRTIGAIKLYRKATAVSLKEAKEFILEVRRRGGLG